jgi:CheY-like chemotaxis protein
MDATMEPYRVLVVDDRREMRDVMSSTVESLGSVVDVTAVPSGEEALLEIRLNHFDLLVADVLLPGINGMELMNKAKERRPDLKVILVTGVLDRQLRRDAAGAGADSFFLKPMAPSDFLDSVVECLDLDRSEKPLTTGGEEKPPDEYLSDSARPEESLSERLDRLHQELESIASILVDEHGRVHARAGELPDILLETGLSPILNATYDASSQVAKFTGEITPKGTLYFSGKKFDLLLAYVGDSFTLVEVFNPIESGDDFGRITRFIYEGVRDLIKILQNLGIDLTHEAPSEIKEDGIDDNDLSVEAPVLDELFQGLDAKAPDDREVDAFWDALAEDRNAGGVQSADVLTYDQALQMGLAPEGDEKD